MELIRPLKMRFKLPARSSEAIDGRVEHSAWLCHHLHAPERGQATDHLQTGDVPHL